MPFGATAHDPVPRDESTAAMYTRTGSDGKSRWMLLLLHKG